MIQRRGFLAGILAAGVAPAFVGAKVLMPVKQIVLPGYNRFPEHEIINHWDEATRYYSAALRGSAGKVIVPMSLSAIIAQISCDRQERLIATLEAENALYD